MGGMNSALVFGRGTEAYMIETNNAVKQERLRREHYRPLPCVSAGPGRDRGHAEARSVWREVALRNPG
jgi:predicted ATPase